jgi:hypothetical protein
LRLEDDFPLARGTLAPFFRASERPIAIACSRLFTLPPRPPFPIRSVPLFRRRIALSTRLLAALPYFRAVDFRAVDFRAVDFRAVDLRDADFFAAIMSSIVGMNPNTAEAARPPGDIRRSPAPGARATMDITFGRAVPPKPSPGPRRTA